MKNFGLFVGNGFTLDFVQPQGLHSSFPLRNFNSLEIQYEPDFIEHIHYVKERLLGSDLPDFHAIKNYIDTFRDVEEEFWYLFDTKSYEYFRESKYDLAHEMHIQLRRFIAMAYSVFQLEVDKLNNMSNWRWVKWIKENKDGLSIAISFNYDLILENAMSLAGIPLFRVGTNESFRKVPVLKPHGSIDFDLPNNYIVADNVWSIHAALSDTQLVKVIPKSKWLSPRIEADIISPSLRNIQIRLSWVRRMFELYSRIANELDCFVIVGCSYWDVDRDEIDFLLSYLHRKTKVYIADPFPNKDLIKKIQSLGLSYREVKPNGLPW